MRKNVHLTSKSERLSDHALGYRCTNTDPEGRYAIIKEIITDPHLACVLQRTEVTGEESFTSKLRLYALCAPHLQVGGWGNNGYVAEVAGRKILMAQKERHMAGARRHGPLSLVHRAATLAEVMAGPTLPTTFKWTGNSIRPLTATLRSREN